MSVRTKVFLFIIILAIFVVIIYAGYFFYLIYFSHQTDKPEKYFVIKKNQGVKEISENLYQAGLVKSKFIFETYVYFKKLEKRFQTGEYFIKPGTSIKELVKILTTGKKIKERQITIIEGWGVREIGQYLEKEGIAQSKKVLELVGFPRVNYKFETDLPQPKDFSQDYDFLKDKPQNYGLEGYLFPDTYRIYEDASVEEIVRKMLDNFGKKLTPDLREEIKKQNKTIYEIITLASIIEKEVAKDEDRKIVAGIFYKRLENNIGLQADSTINYITGKRVTRASSEDIKIDSLYNTYKYRGLPPGPICNPGISAILAAIYPKKTDYWYFLTTPKGKTIFSKTLKEHNKNKTKYLNN